MLVLGWAWSFTSVVVARFYLQREPGSAQAWATMVLWEFTWVGYVHVFLSGVVLARFFIINSIIDVRTGESPLADFKELSLDSDEIPFVLRYGCSIGYATCAAVVLTMPTAFDAHHSSVYVRWALHNGGMMPPMMLILLGGAIGEDPLARNLTSVYSEYQLWQQEKNIKSYDELAIEHIDLSIARILGGSGPSRSDE